MRRFEGHAPIDVSQAPDGWQAHQKDVLDGLVRHFDDKTPVMISGSKVATVHNTLYKFRQCDYAYYVFAAITHQPLEDFGTARHPSTPEIRERVLSG